MTELFIIGSILGVGMLLVIHGTIFKFNVDLLLGHYRGGYAHRLSFRLSEEQLFSDQSIA